MEEAVRIRGDGVREPAPWNAGDRGPKGATGGTKVCSSWTNEAGLDLDIKGIAGNGCDTAG